MMQRLSEQSLTVVDRFQPETMSLQLTERTSTATMTLDDDAPALAVGDWLRSDSGPGSGIVWRVRTIDTQYEKHTRTVTMDHMIASLKDRIMFGETKPEDISGGTTATAEEAVEYILDHQDDWVIGTMARTATKPYTFNGDNLFNALVTVSNTLTECVWEYDFSSYPFTLNMMSIQNSPASEMRMDRNIKTLKRTIDRSRMYTRFYPIGKNDLHLPGEYVSKNENLYGIISKTETDQSKETVDELYDWALDRVEGHADPIVTVTISGEDLSAATGEPLDSFTIGKYCRIPLPEFGTSITERVSKLSYPDIIHDPETVTVTLANELPDIASVYRQEVVEKGGRGGRAGAKNAGEDHAWFVDTDEHVGMIAEAVAGEGADKDWSRVASVMVDGQGVHQRVQYTENQIVQQWSAIEATESQITLEVANAVSDMRSTITQTADTIRSEVSASESTVYSTISQTAGGIRADMVASESGLYSYIDATASYLRTHFVSGANKVFIQDGDPTNDPSYTPRIGDIWIESTHQGTWDGAEGFDWEHDSTYDWSQVQGAKLWGWQNDKWELVSDQQQVVTMGDVEETAERYVNTKVRLVVNDEGNISVYMARLAAEAEQIRAEVYDYAQSLGSSILQTASQIRTEVHAAESYLYSVVEQSASGVIARINESSNVYTGTTAPTGTPDKPIKENDVWIEGIGQRNWADIDDLIDWVDDENYDWSETQGSKVHVYDGTGWREVLDERVLMNNTDFQILADGVHQVSRSIETVNNGLNAYIGRLEVTSKNMKLDYTDRFRQTNSSITATASQIRTEINNTASSLGSSITQTASQIRSEVHAASSSIYSSITQTASQIRSEVANTKNNLQSSITQQADRISLVVEGTGANAHIKPASIVAAINNGSSSVVISADHVNLNGYVSASNFSTVLANLYSAHIQRLYVDSNIYGPNGLSLYANGLWTVTLTSSGNTYTLKQTTLNGTESTIGTFSRAVSSWGVGGGSGKINVTAYPQNQTKSVNVSIDGPTSISSNGSYTYTVDYENLDGDDVSTGRTKTVTVNVPQGVTGLTAWNSGSSSTLYYYDTSSRSYKVATGSGKRWYYKS